MFNQYAAHLSSSIFQSYIQTFLNLLENVLKLKPWYDYADRLSTPTMNLIKHQPSKSPIVWPIYDSFKSIHSDHSIQLNYKLWSKALDLLPVHWKLVGLIRSSCLFVHFDLDISNSLSNPYGRLSNQAFMFGEIMALSLTIYPDLDLKDEMTTIIISSSNTSIDDDIDENSHDSISFVNKGCQTRFDLHRLWFEFIMETLAYWGWFGPWLTNNLVKQICNNLNLISNTILHIINDDFDQNFELDR